MKVWIYSSHYRTTASIVLRHDAFKKWTVGQGLETIKIIETQKKMLSHCPVVEKMKSVSNASLKLGIKKVYGYWCLCFSISIKKIFYYFEKYHCKY